MYLEAVAMIPQIYMFQKQAADQGGFVEVHSNSRLALCLISLLLIIFIGIDWSHSVCIRIFKNI